LFFGVVFSQGFLKVPNLSNLIPPISVLQPKKHKIWQDQSEKIDPFLSKKIQVFKAIRLFTRPILIADPFGVIQIGVANNFQEEKVRCA